MVAGDRGQVGHAHRLAALLIDDRHLAQDLVIARVLQPHLLQEAAVDLADQFVVAGQQVAEQVHAPFLQGLRQQGVVRVGEGPAGDVPGVRPVEVLVVDQQPHQLRHGDGRVGVVELHRPVVRELLHRDAAVVEAAEHVLQGAAHEEVLLLQPQPSALVGAVVGIEHLGEGFAAHLLLHGAVVIADVEGVEIEALSGIGSPQPQPVAGVHPVAQHWHVVGHTDGVLGRDPAHPVGALLIPIALGAAAEAHEAGLVGVGNFPGPATLEPLIGDLHLPAVADQLVEDAEFIADAIAGGRDLQRGQRFQEAGRQTAQAAIAQSRFLFHLEDLVEVGHPEAAQGVGGLIADAEHQQVVAQLRADQEFGREVGHHPRGGGVNRLDAGQIAGHQAVAHGVAERHVEVVAAGRGGELAERVKEVLGHPVEHVIGHQAAAVGIGVATRRRQAQVAAAGFGGGHGALLRGPLRDRRVP